MYNSRFAYLPFVCLYNLREMKFALWASLKEAANARDMGVYALKKTFCVVVGGHEVKMVAIVHGVSGALLGCTR